MALWGSTEVDRFCLITQNYLIFENFAGCLCRSGRAEHHPICDSTIAKPGFGTEAGLALQSSRRRGTFCPQIQLAHWKWQLYGSSKGGRICTATHSSNTTNAGKIPISSTARKVDAPSAYLLQCTAGTGLTEQI